MREGAHGAPRCAHAPPEVEIARALIVAFSEDRLEDVLALTDRDIVWLPQTRPGRSVYTGHAGTAQLMRDARGTLGPFRVVIDHSDFLADGRVRLRGSRVRSAGQAEPFDLLVTVRDRLVLRVDSQDTGQD